MGSEKFHEYYTGKLPPDDPDFKASIALLADVLEKYTNQDAGEEGFSWTNAAQAVLNADAAMFFHGDWAKGYLVQVGGRAGVDFDVSAAPGSTDMFLYGVDVFAMPRHAPNELAARALLTTIASPIAQAAFNRVKGSSPPRTDVPVEQLDPIGQAAMRDLKNARYRMLVRSRPPWDVAIGIFASKRDQAELLKAYVEYPPGGH
jgi:ABC-type glycerol-3-phosphate transport system substrate-binding protein